MIRADSEDVVFSIFPRSTNDTYSQPTDKLHVATTTAAASIRPPPLAKKAKIRTTGHTTRDGVPHNLFYIDRYIDRIAIFWLYIESNPIEMKKWHHTITNN